MDVVIITIKCMEAVFFLIALFYSIKNYRLTKAVSNIWLYISLTTGVAFAVSLIRTIKEFWFYPLFDILTIELIPLVIAFLLAAAVTVRRERRLPKIIPMTEELERSSGIEYKLKRGHIYLKKEESPEGSFDMFVDAISKGSHGLCITRRTPERIREKYKLKKTPIVWLTEMHTPTGLVISPQLERVLHLVGDFIDKSDNSVIVLDGIGYLIHHNNFRRVLQFFHRLRDKIAISNSRLIIPLSPLTIEERELKLLEREADITEI